MDLGILVVLWAMTGLVCAFIYLDFKNRADPSNKINDYVLGILGGLIGGELFGFGIGRGFVWSLLAAVCGGFFFIFIGRVMIKD